MEETAKLTIEYWPLAKLQKHPRNPKSHRLDEIHKSMDRFGYTSPILIDERSGRICAGHGRIDTLLERFARDPGQPPAHIDAQNGEWRVPVIRGLSFKNEGELEAYLIADNRLTEIGGWSNQKLLDILKQQMDTGTLEGTGYDQQALERLLRERLPGPSLAEKFLIPPFSVFDTRQGYWQERRQARLGLGIESEAGRGANLWGISETILKSGKAQTFGTEGNIAGDWTGTSIFDPVLSELTYRWFCPAAGRVLDPFAGGSVRGIVATYLGLKYTGIDLRQEQVDVNRQQAERLKLNPHWIIGDAIDIGTLLPPSDRFDLLFSCPPYFDLEQYSADPRDLSNAPDYASFLASYRTIILAAAARLKPDRFACFVVSDIRDKKGFYRNFVSDTIDAFQAAGLQLYNECILVNVVGSLPLRINKQFVGYRKVGRCHQNVLIFFNGDPKAIRQDFPVIELPDPGEFFGGSEDDDQPATALIVKRHIPDIPPLQIDLIDGIQVVRDDRVPGGTKRRVLAKLLKPGHEYVYASPGCGAAQVALAYTATGLPDTQVTIFTAECKQPHARTLEAMQAGAKVVFVPFGYLSNVRAKARIYAAERQNTVLMPFGLDDPEFHEGLVALARSLAIAPPEEVWSVVGSGTLSRALQAAWPDATFHGVIVGAQQLNTGRARIHIAPEPFTRDAQIKPPFPSCSNYDAKAWRFIKQYAKPGALFWNVAG